MSSPLGEARASLNVAEEPPLKVQGLTVSYDEGRALDDVDLTLSRGTVTALLGMNGSGKSTLFNAVAGLIPAVGGEVQIMGLSPKHARRRNVLGYMPQSENVDWDFPVTVHDVVMTGRYGRLGFTRRPRRDDRKAVAEAIERVGLSEYTHRQIGKLSGGQKKRAFLARSLAQEAQLLLLDEPLAGVDTVSAHTIAEILREVASDGATVLMSVHETTQLRSFVDHAILLKNRVVFRGCIDEVLKPQNLSLAFGGATA